MKATKISSARMEEGGEAVAWPADLPARLRGQAKVAPKLIALSLDEAADAIEGLLKGGWVFEDCGTCGQQVHAFYKPSPDTGKRQACVSKTAKSDTQSGLPIVDDTQGEVVITDEMVERAALWFDDEFNGLSETEHLVRGVLTAALKGGPDGK